MNLRDTFLRALVLFGVAVVAITEILGGLHAIRRVPLALCWLAVLAIVFVYAWRRTGRLAFSRSFDFVVAICLAGIAVILALTAIAAAFSPPNSADAMAYHMPRVIYWAEQASVRFFPTPYLNQIMLQPAAEYLMLHSYVLSGGDRFINFGQWFASVGSMVAVSGIAGQLGASSRGQAAAALFCATIPSGILASSGAKNDYLLAMWLAIAVYFALRYRVSCRFVDAAFLGGALGLALLTKGTAYLFAPWLLLCILPWMNRASMRRLAAGGAIALALNFPHYVRNYNLSGSILGFDSAQGNGVYRWPNDSFGWKETASNILRNTSEQLGDRSDRWNQRVYDWVARAHQKLGIGLDDPRTTWRYESFTPPRSARNHEADANSRWHLAILAIAGCVLVFRGRALYVLALLCGFIAFCAYLKWQPYQARLFLPLFVLGSPLAGLIRVSAAIQVIVCLFLLSSAKPSLLENWIRPLKGPRSVLRVPRDRQYFADMNQWNQEPDYRKTVEALAKSNCGTIGIDINNLQLEYSLQALLRERNPGSVFVHTAVENPSAKYAPPVSDSPCAVVCLNCVGDTKRLELYRSFPVSIPIDRFVVFTR